MEGVTLVAKRITEWSRSLSQSPDTYVSVSDGLEEARLRVGRARLGPLSGQADLSVTYTTRRRLSITRKQPPSEECLIRRTYEVIDVEKITVNFGTRTVYILYYPGDSLQRAEENKRILDGMKIYLERDVTEAKLKKIMESIKVCQE